jgi:hypothetical protein
MSARLSNGEPNKRKSLLDMIQSAAEGFLGGGGNHVEVVDDRSAPQIDADSKIKEAPQGGMLAELQGKGADGLKHVETVDKSAPVIDEHAHVEANARPALLDEIKVKADAITEVAGRGGTKMAASDMLKAVEAGNTELKHVETTDKSAPVIESDTKVKAAAQPEVFAEIKRKSITELKHVDTVDKSAPVIEAEVKVAKSARPSILGEIKAKVAEHPAARVSEVMTKPKTKGCLGCAVM